MSVIFPGNYVAHLNAYREQGCVSLPGVEFYRGVGALVLNPDNDSVLTLDADGNTVLAAGTYDLQILSPDLRQDDKPRKDRPFVIPAGAVVYRTAVNAPGVREATVAGAATPVQVGVSADLIASVKPSAGACRKSPSAIIVEVCYFMPDAVADADDLHIPYAVEAGQGY